MLPLLLLLLLLMGSCGEAASGSGTTAGADAQTLHISMRQ